MNALSLAVLAASLAAPVIGAHVVAAQTASIPSTPPPTPSLPPTHLRLSEPLASFGGQAPSKPSLDFQIFRERVQPVFLDKRAGLARCYTCHSQGTPFRLQRLSPGATTWTERESRKNFEAIQRLVVPADPKPAGCC